MAKATEKKVPTYIPYLDDELKGGIPEGHIILFAGPPGTMKSSLSYFILQNNLEKSGRNAVYITLEQNRDKIQDQMISLGIYNEENHVNVVDIANLRKKKGDKESKIDWLKVLKESIQEFDNKAEGSLIVLDSLNALYSLVEMSNPRAELFHFFQFLQGCHATTFLISEMTLDTPNFSQYDEDFLADGILNMKYREIPEVGLQLMLICPKMRGVPIKRKYYTLGFEKGEFIATTTIARYE